MAQVIERIDALEDKHGINLGVEPENKWLWLTDTSSIKPIHWSAGRGRPASQGYVPGSYTYKTKTGEHKGEHCICAECAKRESIRKELREIGFIYTKEGHKTPTGSVGYYGHHCEAPIPFFRKNKGVKRNPSSAALTTIERTVSEPTTKPDNDMSDVLAALAAL